MFTARTKELSSKEDLINWLESMITPLIPYFSDGKASIHIGVNEAKYGKDVAGFETFARILWGLLPMTIGGHPSKSINLFVEGIKNGTNKNHPEYWGDSYDFSQKIVEMAAFASALLIDSDQVLGYFTSDERSNLLDWLAEGIQFRVADNNWHFFRVLVFTALKKLNWSYNEMLLKESLNRIEDFYLGDGWYSDGETNQRDYYISFAMHYYGLIYAKAIEKEEAEQSQIYKKRAEQFAKDFIYWFDEEGGALPFGRSLTYRFAQSAFWSAAIFAGIQPFSLGVMKGLLFRNLRWWMKQSIFTGDGVLTIGYAYPNLSMSESYNAPGSPYWSFKSFLILALEDEHPFWSIEEEMLPKLEETKVLKHAYMILNHDLESKHVYALTSGQYANYEPNFAECKYAKFAYSNHFSFNIGKEGFNINKIALDSVLALSEQDDYYRVRRKCVELRCEDTFIYSKWLPWHDVSIRTWLVALGAWHVRIHEITTQRFLDSIEGGFSTTYGPDFTYSNTDFMSMCHGGNGSSAIVNLIGERNPDYKESQPNTNLTYPCKMETPVLTGTLDPGVHWMASAVVATPFKDRMEELLLEIPKINLSDNQITIYYRKKTVSISY